MVCEQPRLPTVRFAPSPHGHLHIGHAYSAILNHNYARESGGRFLLRIEDIDRTRCRADLLAQMLDDLHWLGLTWEQPVRRQSQHVETYRSALMRLADRVPLYLSSLTRKEIGDHVGAYEREHGTLWPRDPDGAPLYPGIERPAWGAPPFNIAEAEDQAVRIAMDQAVDRLDEPLTWNETGCGPNGETGLLTADPLAWGDVVLARKDIGTSYMLSVVVDDAIQGITHVIRGQDLFRATGVQRLLQHFLDLSAPVYHHHGLLLDTSGQKLSKSRGSVSIKSLREGGSSRDDVFGMIGIRPL